MKDRLLFIHFIDGYIFSLPLSLLPSHSPSRHLPIVCGNARNRIVIIVINNCQYNNNQQLKYIRDGERDQNIINLMEKRCIKWSTELNNFEKEREREKTG